MAIEIVDFPIKNGGSFHGKMLVHQRVVHFGSKFQVGRLILPMSDDVCGFGGPPDRKLETTSP